MDVRKRGRRREGCLGRAKGKREQNGGGVEKHTLSSGHDIERRETDTFLEGGWFGITVHDDSKLSNLPPIEVQ